MVQMNSMEFRSVVEPLLNDCFDGIYESLPRQWSQVFKVETALPRRYQEDPILSGFGSAVRKEEGQGVTYDAGREAYRVRFVQKTYALAYAMTEELIEDGDHLSIGKIYSEHLALAMEECREIVHAQILNRAETAGYLGGDGVTLLSTAHPLVSGATFSNRLTTAANLSEASLEQLLTQIDNAVDERGKRINLQSVKLIVAPGNRWNAHRILKSTKRVGTADNDANAIKDMGVLSDIVVMTRLTNAQQYFIQTNAPRGLVCKDRAKLRRSMEGDFETGNMRYKARFRFEPNWIDPRCLFGSAGA